MTANELADELENTYPFVGVMEVAATKLRQQQESIEGLTRDYDLLFAEHQLLLKNTKG